MATTERHNFQKWAAGFTLSDIILNDLLAQLETKLGLSVTSRTTAAQPGSPTAGECYILPSTPTGAQWAAWNQHDIVIYQEGTWMRIVPITGWPSWVEDGPGSGEGVIFDGSAWIVISADLSAYMQQTVFDADFDAIGTMWANDGAGDYGVIKANLTAIIDPTVNDDVDLGYTAYSPWINTVGTGEGATIWFCLDNTDGAAVWQQVGSGSGGGGLIVEFKSASFTAVAGYKYKCDTTSNAIVVTLPAGTNLDNIIIQDDKRNAKTNNITINPNGAETIDDDTVFIIDQDGGGVDIGYETANTNWSAMSFGTPDIINVADYFDGPFLYEVSIDDDDVWVFDFGQEATAASLIVTTNVSGNQGIFAVRARTSSAFVASIAGTGIDTTTGVLTGTTGTDTNMTISAHTDNKLYIENRLGANRVVSITINWVKA